MTLLSVIRRFLFSCAELKIGVIRCITKFPSFFSLRKKGTPDHRLIIIVQLDHEFSRLISSDFPSDPTM